MRSDERALLKRERHDPTRALRLGEAGELWLDPQRLGNDVNGALCYGRHGRKKVTKERKDISPDYNRC